MYWRNISRNYLSVKMKETVLLFLITFAKPSASATAETIVTTCGDVCVNGNDSGYCVDNCTCEVNDRVYFLGSKCEYLLFNNEIITSSTSARTANFTWPSPPNIATERYKFVYIKAEGDYNYDETLKYSVDDFKMITECTARLTDLEAGNVAYKVCVINSSDDTLMDSEVFNNDTCMFITTQEGGMAWEFTISAIVVGSGVIVAVVVLITLRLILDGIHNRKKNQNAQAYSKIDGEQKVKEKSKKAKSNHKKGKMKETDSAAEKEEVTGYTNPVIDGSMDYNSVERKDSVQDDIDKNRNTGLNNSFYEPAEIYEELDGGGNHVKEHSHQKDSIDHKSLAELSSGVDYFEQEPHNDYHRYEHSHRDQEIDPLDTAGPGWNQTVDPFYQRDSEMQPPRESTDLNYSMLEPDY